MKVFYAVRQKLNVFFVHSFSDRFWRMRSSLNWVTIQNVLFSSGKFPFVDKVANLLDLLHDNII